MIQYAQITTRVSCSYVYLSKSANVILMEERRWPTCRWWRKWNRRRWLGVGARRRPARRRPAAAAFRGCGSAPRPAARRSARRRWRWTAADRPASAPSTDPSTARWPLAPPRAGPGARPGRRCAAGCRGRTDRPTAPDRRCTSPKEWCPASTRRWRGWTDASAATPARTTATAPCAAQSSRSSRSQAAALEAGQSHRSWPTRRATDETSTIPSPLSGFESVTKSSTIQKSNDSSTLTRWWILEFIS